MLLALAWSVPSVDAGQVEKERAREPVPVVLDLGAMRYEAVHWGKALGLGQNGGFLMARRRGEVSPFWLHRVYLIDDNDGKEGDKQDCFITRLALEIGGKALRVTNDRAHIYRFDLRTLQSRLLARTTPAVAPALLR